MSIVKRYFKSINKTTLTIYDGNAGMASTLFYDIRSKGLQYDTTYDRENNICRVYILGKY